MKQSKFCPEFRAWEKYYENICISSDFDGLDDPLDLFASPRMYPVMALYIANRLKWDLYRRYCVDDYDPQNPLPSAIEGNKTIGPERGQTLPVDDGYIMKLTNLSETDLNGIVKDIMKQILDTNFINMVAYARGWATPPTP